eukprot:m.27978 g.27978  ORF g.27978 m.27978 type:complete len:278 (-) comp14051_c0_seq1:66-899(-)
MFRIFGRKAGSSGPSYSRVPTNDGGEGQASPPEPTRKCDAFLFIIRACLLIAGVICGFVALAKFVAAQKQQVHNGCPLSLHAFVTVKEDMYGSRTPCDFVLGSLGCGAGLLTFFLALCLWNLCKRRLTPRPGCAARIQLIMKGLVTLFVLISAVVITVMWTEVCEDAEAWHKGSCETILNQANATSCAHCSQSMFDGLYSNIITARNAAYGASVASFFVFLMALVRDYRARKAQQQEEGKESKTGSDAPSKEASASETQQKKPKTVRPGVVHKLLLS